MLEAVLGARNRRRHNEQAWNVSIVREGAAPAETHRKMHLGLAERLFEYLLAAR
jgi:hypothetical protein